LLDEEEVAASDELETETDEDDTSDELETVVDEDDASDELETFDKASTHATSRSSGSERDKSEQDNEDKLIRAIITNRESRIKNRECKKQDFISYNFPFSFFN